MSPRISPTRSSVARDSWKPRLFASSQARRAASSPWSTVAKRSRCRESASAEVGSAGSCCTSVTLRGYAAVRNDFRPGSASLAARPAEAGSALPVAAGGRTPRRPEERDGALGDQLRPLVDQVEPRARDVLHREVVGVVLVPAEERWELPGVVAAAVRDPAVERQGRRPQPGPAVPAARAAAVLPQGELPV